MKTWCIEPTGVEGNYFVYSLEKESFLGLKCNKQVYVKVTVSDGQNDLEWNKIFDRKSALKFVAEAMGTTIL